MFRDMGIDRYAIEIAGVTVATSLAIDSFLEPILEQVHPIFAEPAVVGEPVSGFFSAYPMRPVNLGSGMWWVYLFGIGIAIATYAVVRQDALVEATREQTGPTTPTLTMTEQAVTLVQPDGDHTQELSRRADPSAVHAFIRRVVDAYDQQADDAADTSLQVLVSDTGDITIRDAENGEYARWALDDWVMPAPGVVADDWHSPASLADADDRTVVDPDAVRTMLETIQTAYEDPETIRTTYDRTPGTDAPELV